MEDVFESQATCMLCYDIMSTSKIRLNSVKSLLCCAKYRYDTTEDGQERSGQAESQSSGNRLNRICSENFTPSSQLMLFSDRNFRSCLAGDRRNMENSRTVSPTRTTWTWTSDSHVGFCSCFHLQSGNRGDSYFSFSYQPE